MWLKFTDKDELMKGEHCLTMEAETWAKTLEVSEMNTDDLKKYKTISDKIDYL